MGASTASAAGNIMAFSTSSNRAYINGSYVELGMGSETGSLKPVLESGRVYLPVDIILKNLGGSYSYDAEKKIAMIITPQKNVWFTSTKLKTLYQQRDKITKSYVMYRAGTVFMEANQLARLIGYDVYNNEDIVVITNQDEPTAVQYEAIQSKLYFERPSEEQIIADIVRQNPGNAHPRLYARSEDFAGVRELIKTDPDAQSWWGPIKKRADAAIDAAPYRWELRDGMRLLYVSNDVTARVQTLAFAYQVTQDEIYAQRAYLELKTVCEYPNWTVDHFLDLGQMLHGVAVGYDWIYEWMNDEQREIIKNGIVNLGLNRLKFSYDDFWTGKALNPTANPASWWTRTEANWNPWVNSGAILGALVVGDEEPELSGYILRSALSSLELCLDALAPDGGSVEGIGYGEGATKNFTLAMAALDTACGTDYGYFNAPGYADFAYFLNFMVGPVTAFNYHDSGNNTRLYFSNSFYVANKNNDYPMAKLRLMAIRNGNTTASLFDLLWYKPGEYESADTSASLDKYFRKVETGSMRSSYEDENAIWLGFHGGANYVSHAHLDSGQFVLDAMGLNWALDLGTEMLTYEATKRYDDAWLLYRRAPMGHNTLQINLNSEYGQLVDSESTITKFESKTGGAFAVLDMSQAYSHVASSIRRGFMLTDSRKRVVIQDEILLKAKSDIWWFMHTLADIDVSEDGKTAILTQKGKTMRATIVEPANATFYAMEAQPMPGTPTNEFQEKNEGVHKLALNVPDTIQTNIMVELMPVYSDYDMEKEPLVFAALDDWSVENSIEALPTVDKIFIDGEPLDGFSSNLTAYDVPVIVGSEKIPVISALSDYKLEIIQPDDPQESKSEIRVYNENGEIGNVYVLNFANKPFVGLPKNGRRAEIVGVTASTYQNDDSYKGYPENAIDGDRESRWAALGDQWIMLELEEAASVNYICLAYYSGAARKSYFEAEVSEDGIHWTKVYSGETSGNTADYESYSIYPTKARFVRINGHGNSLSEWNSITEIAVFYEE